MIDLLNLIRSENAIGFSDPPNPNRRLIAIRKLTLITPRAGLNQLLLSPGGSSLFRSQRNEANIGILSKPLSPHESKDWLSSHSMFCRGYRVTEGY